MAKEFKCFAMLSGKHNSAIKLPISFSLSRDEVVIALRDGKWAVQKALEQQSNGEWSCEGVGIWLYKAP